MDASFPDDLRAEIGECGTWFSSPEPKARQTARLLADHPVRVDGRLREVGRGHYLEDYEAAVARHFEDLDAPAAPGWETGQATRRRLEAWLDDVRADPQPRIAAVTHGLALTHLHRLLTGVAASLGWWKQLQMPDVRVYAR